MDRYMRAHMSKCLLRLNPKRSYYVVQVPKQREFKQTRLKLGLKVLMGHYDNVYTKSFNELFRGTRYDLSCSSRSLQPPQIIEPEGFRADAQDQPLTAISWDLVARRMTLLSRIHIAAREVVRINVVLRGASQRKQQVETETDTAKQVLDWTAPVQFRILGDYRPSSVSLFLAHSDG
ncbi:hypothetical protein BC939DRAFT_533612 [Gamsiella multidivaricata]|uniref:uncharacterized protein n=1 Tax=Gamsiella multidivaricata TaxID=101098 RepID=UPI00221F8D57|nr:uncharacterized protein BC939DRAFT_533612 [Gamsiella multidivaricata]KAI7816378.1 hypothetical protein BC939DRAFT_533612 [Gamsiella multidivaricata]